MYECTKQESRRKLINCIMDLSADEFDTFESMKELAMESESQLIDRVIDIANYYKNIANGD